MISINITGISEVKTMLSAYPKQAGRACEMAIDQTVKEMRDEVKDVMRKVFDQPVAYTINSVKVLTSQGHNMRASVFIATPERMQQSYLVPQVEGTARKIKGFEMAADGKEYDLGAGAKRTKAGNITVPQAKAIVTGVKRGGDYVLITQAHGKLLPGVYQRFKTTKGFSAKVNRTGTHTLQRGMTKGRFTSAIGARGLKTILSVKPTQGARVKPLLLFYTIAQQVFDRRFVKIFNANLARLLP